MQAFNVQSLEGAGAAFLPDQSPRSWRPEALRPEQRLMLAVLRDAVQVFQVCGTSAATRERRLFREADEWFAAADCSDPFGFGTICDVLGFDADCLYTGVRRSLDWRRAAPEPGRRRRWPKV